MTALNGLQVDIVCGSYPPDVCGVADYSRLLASSLRDRGVDVSIITSAGRTADSDLPVLPEVHSWGRSGVADLAGLLETRRPDLVHIQFPTLAYHGNWGIGFLPRMLKNIGIPSLCTLHEYCLAPWGGRLKQMLMVSAGSGVIVTNDQDRTLLERWAPPGGVHQVPIGSNIRPTGSPQQGVRILGAIGACPERPALVFFGLLYPGKGFETAVEALSLLPVPSRPQLLVVSPPPDPLYLEELQEKTASLGLEDSILQVGYLEEEDVSSLLLAVTGALLPFSDGATWRRGSLLAALAHGTPVITTSSPATPRQFRHRENMLLSPVGEASAMAANIRLLCSDQQTTSAISAGARKLAEPLQWDSIADQTIEVYRSILGPLT